MKKLLNIDGKEIILSSNGAAPIIYKKEFKRDFFSDLAKLADQDNFDFEVVYNFFYVFAKIGNKDIVDFEDFFSQFDNFGIGDYVSDVVEIATSCISTQNNIKNIVAAVNN